MKATMMTDCVWAAWSYVEPVADLSPSPWVTVTPLWVAVTFYYMGTVIFLHAWRNR